MNVANNNPQQLIPWSAIIPLLILFWPVGLILLYLRLTFDKTNIKKNARVLRYFGIGFVIGGILFALGAILLGFIVYYVMNQSGFAMDKTIFIEVSAILTGVITLILIIIGVVLMMLSVKKKKQDTTSRMRGQGNENMDGTASLRSIVDRRNSVLHYLQTNDSTEYFSSTLTAIAQRLDAFYMSCNIIKDIIVKRFGAAGLSYHKFTAPIEELQEYICSLVDSLILRMHAFNEENYQCKIADLTRNNRLKEAEEYKEIEREHQGYAHKTLAALNDAIIKVDKLVIEVSKLSEADFDNAAAIMADLETAIKDAPLYRG